MPILDVQRLAGFEHQLDLDLDRIGASGTVADRRLYTYLVTYPHLVSYFAGRETIGVTEFVIGKAIAYSLMPTTMNLRGDDIEAVLGPINELKRTGRRLSTLQLEGMRSIVNNSIVGASKLLHFVRPDVYPVWDSRVDRFLHGDDLDTNSIERYRAYLAFFDRIAAEPAFEPLRRSLERKLGYAISAARALEMILYLSDLLGLSFQPPPDPGRIDRGEVDAEEPIRPVVPMFKRDAYTFVSNLGAVTLDPAVPDTLMRNGYLLSERYTTNTHLALAAIARGRRKLMISDNGNWTRMSAIAREFDSAGAALLNRARDEAADGGVRASTRAERQALMDTVARACARAVEELDLPGIIETQLRMAPHYMIGLEDFTIPVLMMIGLLDPVFSPDAAEVAGFQRRTRELFARQVAGEFGFLKELESVAMFLVVHAFDYRSARTGAEAARAVTKDGLAISYGAPMRSRRWINEIALGDVVEDLGENLPEAYLAAHALTIGVANGHGDDIPVHILGVGTPILVLMIGFLLKHSRAVSIDSSAPMLDAFDGRIYGARQAYLKMRMYRVAALALVEDRPYESRTPFFVAFNQRHPDDWSGLRRELGVTADTDPRELERVLETSQDLVRTHIPFFTRLTSSDDPFFWDLRVSRTGHNYCVLRQIVDRIRHRRDNWPALKAWTENEIARYAAVGDPRWARAVEKCFELTIRHRLVPGA